MKKLYLTLMILAIVTVGTACLSNKDKKDSQSNVVPSQYKKVDFVIIGDTQNQIGLSAFKKLVGHMVQMSPSIVFHTGDLVDEGTSEKEWQDYRDTINPLGQTAKIYAAIGNHDVKGLNHFFNNVDNPTNQRWFSIDYKNCHFIILDSYSDKSPGSEQYQWLENDLKNNRGDKLFTVVFFHYPPYTTGNHEEDTETQETFVKLFEKYNVDMVFSGHNHCYERFKVNDIHYIVTGGGGGFLWGQNRKSPYLQVFKLAYHFCSVTINDNSLLYEVFDSTMEKIDSLSISK